MLHRKRADAVISRIQHIQEPVTETDTGVDWALSGNRRYAVAVQQRRCAVCCNLLMKGGWSVGQNGQAKGSISRYETLQPGGLQVAGLSHSIVTVPPYSSLGTNGGKKCVSS